MYKVTFKNKKEDERQLFKYFITEEKAKLFQNQLIKEGQHFEKLEDMDDKTNNIKN